jgi:hypothetical protein
VAIQIIEMMKSSNAVPQTIPVAVTIAVGKLILTPLPTASFTGERHIVFR